MSKWIPAHGAKVRLVARPGSIQKTAGANGDLHLECENRSMRPITLAILSLYSDDPNVAAPLISSATPGASPSLNVPRRPNKNSAATPSTRSVKVGQWNPQNPGNTSVGALVNMLQGASVVNPKDDVMVT